MDIGHLRETFSVVTETTHLLNRENYVVIAVPKDGDGLASIKHDGSYDECDDYVQRNESDDNPERYVVAYTRDEILHARAIAALPRDVREVVMDALRVRAMDFVSDRLRTDGGDFAADIYRSLDPGADSNDAFDPDLYKEN